MWIGSSSIGFLEEFIVTNRRFGQAADDFVSGMSTLQGTYQVLNFLPLRF
jgi:hypothetical protein